MVSLVSDFGFVFSSLACVGECGWFSDFLGFCFLFVMKDYGYFGNLIK